MTLDGAAVAGGTGGGAEPQAVLAPLTKSAIFLVAVASTDETSIATLRELCGDLAGLVRAVGFRDPEATLTCVTGIGHRLWDILGGTPRPAGLHEFRELRAPGRHAVSTPGDLLFHIRAKRMDLCYELATQLMFRAGDAFTVVDEVHGFKYFDNRDVIGFVDGTENPTGAAAAAAALIGPEDDAFAGGSYVIVQKYLHDLAAWNATPVEEQERIIGRRKLSDIELTDDVKPPYAHNALTSITGPGGEERQILRDNMPFAAPGTGEHGTYFIGYARSPDVTELMLRNMFIGDPEGTYDRLLDFSRAVTGGLFFVPSQPVLDMLADGPLGSAADADDAHDADPDEAGYPGGAGSANGRDDHKAAVPAGSLQIGSMKGTSPDE